MILPVLSTPDCKLISSRFSGAAERYDCYAEHHRQIAKELVDIIGKTECCRILELGCGTGILSEALRNIHPNASMLLTDSAPGMVSVCRARVHPSSLVRHFIWNFENSECPESFDLVVSSCSLQWLRRPVDFGPRLHKMVSPGGCTIHAIPVRGMLKEFQGSFSRTGTEWPSLDYLSGDEWDEILIQSGFSILDSFTKTFPVKYNSPSEALKAVRGIGASLNGHTGSPVVHPAALRNALNYYGENYRDSQGKVPASYEVHFLKASRF